MRTAVSKGQIFPPRFVECPFISFYIYHIIEQSTLPNTSISLFVISYMLSASSSTFSYQLILTKHYHNNVLAFFGFGKILTLSSPCAFWQKGESSGTNQDGYEENSRYIFLVFSHIFLLFVQYSPMNLRLFIAGYAFIVF